ncbi:hypothetical protein [Streptomyces sp. NRRL S-237]|nr:hypothetical protein [Streptomyces sp. NRRL S-237]
MSRPGVDVDGVAAGRHPCPDPEDLTLCRSCNHGYDLRDHHDYAS